MRGDQGSGPYAPGRSPAAVRFAHPLPSGMGPPNGTDYKARGSCLAHSAASSIKCRNLTPEAWQQDYLASYLTEFISSLLRAPR